MVSIEEPIMYPSFPVEMSDAVAQMMVYFIAAAGALIGYMLSLRA